MIRRPMLAAKIETLEKLRYPLLGSPKLDGIRAIRDDGKLLSRTRKPIRNKFTQAIFYDLPDGLDGELIVGSPTATDTFRRTDSGVMTIEGKPDVWYYVFDYIPLHLNQGASYATRLGLLQGALEKHTNTRVIVLPQVKITSAEEALEAEESFLEQGYEGMIMRESLAPYKYGRSTLREQYLLKVKRFADGEGVVVGYNELMHNDNPAGENALGLTERSSRVEGKVPGNMLGSLSLKDIVTGQVFAVGTGFTLEMRREFWKGRSALVGKIVKYKHFPKGEKDLPRMPKFVGFRSKEDM